MSGSTMGLEGKSKTLVLSRLGSFTLRPWPAYGLYMEGRTTHIKPVRSTSKSLNRSGGGWLYARMS